MQGKKGDGSHKASEDMNKQTIVGAHLRGVLYAGLLIDPIEQGFDRLTETVYGLRKELVRHREPLMTLFLFDRGEQLEILIGGIPVELVASSNCTGDMQGDSSVTD